MGDAVKELRRELKSVRQSIKENEERYAGLSAEEYESLGNAYVELNLGLRERETELVEAIRVEMERRVERMERRRREAAEAKAEIERRVERMERRRREAAEAKAEIERRVERMERRRREAAEAKAKESKNESDDDMPFYRKPK